LGPTGQPRTRGTAGGGGGGGGATGCGGGGGGGAANSQVRLATTLCVLYSDVYLSPLSVLKVGSVVAR